MTMKTFTAVDAKTRFGQLIDTAQREPVIVTKKNRPVGVFFSIEDIENTIWAEQVKAAEAEGYLSAEDSLKQINALLHAQA
jgi:prevent-host-death family protein